MSRSSPSSAECYESLAGRGDDEEEESGPVTSHRSESVLLVNTKACSKFKISAAVHNTGNEAWQLSQLKPPTFGQSAQGVIRFLRCQRGEGRDTSSPSSPPPCLEHILEPRLIRNQSGSHSTGDKVNDIVLKSGREGDQKPLPNSPRAAMYIALLWAALNQCWYN